jgi:hypothetical protein
MIVAMLTFMYITNRPDLARVCDRAGVHRIFVDMEWKGKDERQGHIDSVKFFHTLEDVASIRRAVTRSEVLVRVNPVDGDTADEVDGAIEAGADLLMLPMAKTCEDVRCFVKAVGGRVKTVLLLETRAAEENIIKILQAGGIDEVHIGLNDLALEYGLPFMFTLLADGTVERICGRIRPFGIPYGFGGVSSIGGSGRLPAENILMEHIRLGSTRVILSRGFYNVAAMHSLAQAEAVFFVELARLREAEANFRVLSERDLLDNAQRVRNLCR